MYLFDSFCSRFLIKGVVYFVKIIFSGTEYLPSILKKTSSKANKTERLVRYFHRLFGNYLSDATAMGSAHIWISSNAVMNITALVEMLILA